jgi:deoxyadenosine/deoxycytidine kinase
VKYNYIVIEGNIGAGKTSLVKMIAEKFNAKTIFEQFADNPFLPKFYKNSERFSFPLELSFLAERYHQLKKDLSDRDLFKTFTISDYYFMKSLIFAKSTLADDEYKLFKNLFFIIYESLPKPDLYVYLHLPVEKLIENIKLRGRNYEQNIEANYLTNIQNGYFNYFNQQKYMKFLIIDKSNIDFVNSKTDFESIVDVIFNKDYSVGINRILI